MSDKKQTTRRPTPKQIKAAKLLSENIGKEKPAPVGEILREAGYSESVSESPTLVTDSPTFQELLETYLPNKDLAETHRKLLTSRKLDHMVFPVYNDPEAGIPEEGDIPDEYLEEQAHGGALKRSHKVVEGSVLTDDDITALLAEVNCVVRKIVHGDQTRHVYFWADNVMAQQKALELGYKMRGLLSPDSPKKGPTLNVFFGKKVEARKYVDAED